MFAAIYHPVGMAMLIEASNARGRTLAFNGVCGNIGVVARCRYQRGACNLSRMARGFPSRPVLCVLTGIVYLWVTPDDRHQARSRDPTCGFANATPSVMLFGLFIVIALGAGLPSTCYDRVAESRR